MSKKISKKKSKNILGTFTLDNDQFVVGELKLKGAETLLKLHSDKLLQMPEHDVPLNGITYGGDFVTLVDCVSSGIGERHKGQITRYYADVFPHYVALGKQHLDPINPCIKEIHFSITDITTLFYDFDAFGTLINPNPIIDSVLQERRIMRPVESGDNPQICYYTGKDCIAEIPTKIGNISINHRPTYSLGGPRGVYISNKIFISIKPQAPVTFKSAIDNIYLLCNFLSTTAGRIQGIKDIQINLHSSNSESEFPNILNIYPSFLPKTRKSYSQSKPHPADIPLDPIHRPEEFSSVIQNWIDRHDDWFLSRSRYINCLSKGNSYGVDRLVAAANMFDILPLSAFPQPTPLDHDFLVTKETCISLLKQHPSSSDRDSALSALGRLGQLSLPKKVAHRVSIIDEKLGNQFSELQLVAKIAVKCRNFYVHGSSDGLDIKKMEEVVPFLTDALEFIFAASDFIEAGWDATTWKNSDFIGSGHSFTRFRLSYRENLTLAKKILHTK
ncbi:MAG: hypothetical protein QMB48_00235 [Burkholderiaceae bacterium]